MADTNLAETSFIDAVRRRQRTSLLVTAFITLALLAAIGGLMLFSWIRLTGLRAEIATQSAALQDVTAKLQATQQALATAEKSVAEASNFVKHVHSLDWRNEKLLASRYPHTGRLLEVLGQVQQQNPHFGVQNNPSGGFTSPGLADYVLARAAGPDVKYDTLPLRNGAPQPGDVIRYDAGYTMFFFQDVPPNATPFVVGMTPIGIAALDPNFGPPIVEVRKTPFSE